MNTLKITLSTPGPEWIAGTPYSLTIYLENFGQARLSVPSPDAPRPFSFIVTRLDEDGGQRELSLLAASRSRRPDVPPLPVVKEEIDPGAKLEYPVDLAEFAVPPLSVGRYRVSAVLQWEGLRVESEPFSLTVLPPRVTQMAVAGGPSQNTLVIFFAHLLPGPKAKLFHYESRPSRPDDGLAYERAVTEGAGVDGTSVAVELYANRGVRWYAWLREGMLSAGVAQRHTVFREFPAVSVGLESPSLQEVGWQSDHETAIFAVMGHAEGKGAKMVLVRFSRGEPMGVVLAFPLGLPEAPLAWTVRLPDIRAGEVFEAIMGVGDQEGFKVLSQSLSLIDGEVGPPKSIAEIRGRLLAMTYPPVGNGVAGHLNLLYETKAGTGEIVFNRFSLAGDEAKKWCLSGPLGESETQTPVLWALPSTEMENPALMALTGGRLFFRWLNKDEDWREWPDPLRNVKNLRLEVIAGAPYVVWADPRDGFRIVRLPD